MRYHNDRDRRVVPSKFGQEPLHEFFDATMTVLIRTVIYSNVQQSLRNVLQRSRFHNAVDSTGKTVPRHVEIENLVRKI